MTIRKFRAGRVANANVSDWVGETGTLFYDEVTGQLKIADGTTPGGHYVNLVVATATQLGGIKAGPGANVSVDGTLTIDTTGIPLSIGDLYIAQANISAVNANEDLNLLTSGTGDINIVGNLHVHTTAQGPNYPTPILEARNTGNVYVNGNLITNGGTYLVGTTTFVGPTSHTGNLITDGNLVVNGPSYFNGNITEVGNLFVTGNSVNDGTSIFNGATTFNGNTIRNGATISTGSVTWNGTTTTNGTAINNGPTTFNGNMNITGNTVQTGNLTITGVTINNGLSIFNGDITMTGNAAIVGNTRIAGNTLVTGTTTVAGNTLVTGNTQVLGTTYLTGNSYVTGNTFVTGTTTVAGNTYVTGAVTTITGNTYLTGNSFVTGATTVTGNITSTGNLLQTGVSTFIVSTNSSNTGGVEISGNTKGYMQPPALPGVMLHVTGQDNGTTPSRSYFDGVGQYSIIVGRRYNGTIANPTQAVTGDEVFRLAGTGYPTGGWPLTGLAQIRFIADEAQTQTNRGGHLDFLTVPIGSNVMTQSMSISATTGVSIAGNLQANVNATIVGNVTAGNVTATNFYGTATRVSNALTAGYGLQFSSGTTYDGGTALTLNRYEGVSTPTATGSGGNGWTYSLDLGTSTGLVFLNVGGNFAGTVTLAGTPVPGRITRLVIVGGIKGATLVTVSGLTAANSSNGLNTFAATSGTASSVIVEFYASTTALSGVYMNTSGAK